jgi:hypothetical protein
LRELDIEAQPVVLSTRNNGIINQSQIMLEKFNYVIAMAQIDNQTILMDATQKNYPYFMLPQRCLNNQGRIITATGGGWINLDTGKDNVIHTEARITLEPSGALMANMMKKYTRYERTDFDDHYRSFTNEEEFLDRFEARRPGAEIDNFSLENRDDWSLPLIASFTMQYASTDNTTKKLLYVNPLLGERMTVNPFTREERLFPVDFIYPHKRSFSITIEVPQGYTIEEIPRNARIIMPRNAATYNSLYSRNDNGDIVVTVEMDINKPLFLPEEYRELRNFYAKIVEEEARSIVLKNEMIQ